ncbi:ComEA family DNA-binding protein [Desulfurispirillum indicum]|uniref:Competence protein ComEA helix-hairpin-helix repeat protein n=1 Tax=Desulfurispirillum indicum (strain ATCC BAA-1389 / DSM 22839 / S5) TaxID=653733 RepID=E6W091_DESIS|nr:ComEA family DNA-binding protein [Desulfurispirillum indicum]ADU65217.1 competence protein ComEA helix-hairpin-helix repeat protein [Desulfurispirillum indicum S5]UCZ57107.1 ComEA family DNA-binding protein [Desulfurispirillum indicum]
MVRRILALLCVIGLAFGIALAKVNINTASQAELAALNGVGDQRAAAIIEYREQNGPFQKPEDITRVKGIGKSTFERNKDSITVE